MLEKLKVITLHFFPLMIIWSLSVSLASIFRAFCSNSVGSPVYKYDKILSWHRVAGKAGVDYPPKVSVLPNFDVKVNRKEEAVNF